MSGIFRLGAAVRFALLAAIIGFHLNGNGVDATERAPERLLAPSSAESETTSEGAVPAETAPTDIQVAAAPRLRNWQEYPVDLFLLDPNIDPEAFGVITNRMVSQASLTTPSLWWTQDQFGGKLLENWLAYPGSEEEPRRVDLIVDRQLWGLSTYLERYTFVNRFGTTAKSFGYSIRVFSDQGNPLATYICNFPSSLINERAIADAGAVDTRELDCNISLDSSGAGALRGRPGGFESLF